MKKLKTVTLGPLSGNIIVSLWIYDSSDKESIKVAKIKWSDYEKTTGNKLEKTHGFNMVYGNKIEVVLNKATKENILFAVLPHELRHTGDYLSQLLGLNFTEQSFEPLALMTGELTELFSMSLIKEGIPCPG